MDYRGRCSGLARSACRLLVVLLCFWSNSCCGQDVTRRTIEVVVDGKRHVGWPIASDDTRYVLLRRDGSYKVFEHNRTSYAEKLSNDFEPYPIQKFIQRLREVYNDGYEVTDTRHFVIVHPSGEADLWTHPFEDLYQEIFRYAAARGMDFNEPEFPQVAIIFSTRQEYDAYLVRHGAKPRRDIVGVYLPSTNRIVTYDRRNFEQRKSGNVERVYANLQTVYHETAHQVAFNAGIQNRFAVPPRWICEGFAMMFESLGKGKSVATGNWEAAVGRARCDVIRRLANRGELSGMIEQLVVDDRPFRTDTTDAYAASWALTFYLAECQPAEFGAYMNHLAETPNFTESTGRERIEVFARYFGSDIPTLSDKVDEFCRQP